jgi:hypothetical protein
MPQAPHNSQRASFGASRRISAPALTAASAAVSV